MLQQNNHDLKAHVLYTFTVCTFISTVHTIPLTVLSITYMLVLATFGFLCHNSQHFYHKNGMTGKEEQLL